MAGMSQPNDRRPPSATPTEGGPLTFTPHAERAAVLDELHARPFEPIRSPCRAIRFAFLTDLAQMSADAGALRRFCADNRLGEWPPGAKHQRIVFPDAVLRWEQHSEFTTYTWILDADTEHASSRLPATVASTMAHLGQPGPHLVSIDLRLNTPDPAHDIAHAFDPASLAASQVLNGHATIATDFKADADGFVRFQIEDRGLTPIEVGGLVLRLLEIETYRCFALLGLPLSHRVTPIVRDAENRLTGIMNAMSTSSGLDTNRELLDEITSLAARIEAEAATANYRFAASAAYDGIVQQRLEVIGEKSFGGWPTLADFLARRLNPAMRTCQTLNARLLDLNNKLTRAANLLRTRIDVEIEQQNRDLLAAMSERARLQLRLQQTVEGLSVAAISYYVASLLHYMFESVSHYWPINATVATGISIPFVVIVMAILLSRIKHGHGKA
jgi:uncharacterized membrane-anchored protein